ncbi:GNAT superfamily N-acetyltransferase [Sporomusaceae bacterium BoRhaA]|uniref:GNAT family N-acetyltransferase n=1 Tax=Pelorhabdus rhamnosifermentans TaxID=2772457 RepID=UPI001C05F2DD|nr:GNAT family N-acetyltransferase [Pelorhabdus rhamnosifermentans]MBU2699566.1 GNAT superfamily N-acetyltransferase [Pelorhabdus rhamnosifermentans]
MTEIIKEYEPQYKSEIINFILEIQQQEFHIPITQADQPDLNDIPHFYQSKSGNFWMAIDKGAVVGTISLLDIGNNQGVLRKLFVKADHRGKEHHAAKLLLQQLMEWAREHRISEIYLGTTDKFLAAHRFYEKNHFTSITKERLPKTFPLMKVDTIFYQFLF